jgi:hypothetical protein
LRPTVWGRGRAVVIATAGVTARRTLDETDKVNRRVCALLPNTSFDVEAFSVGRMQARPHSAPRARIRRPRTITLAIRYTIDRSKLADVEACVRALPAAIGRFGGTWVGSSLLPRLAGPGTAAPGRLYRQPRGAAFRAWTTPFPARIAPRPSAGEQNLVKVMSLISLADFLIHRVVLQNRVCGAGRVRALPPRRTPPPMFHVKHFCVKADFLPPALQPAADRNPGFAGPRQRVGTGVPEL